MTIYQDSKRITGLSTDALETLTMTDDMSSDNYTHLNGNTSVSGGKLLYAQSSADNRAYRSITQVASTFVIQWETVLGTASNGHRYHNLVLSEENTNVKTTSSNDGYTIVIDGKSGSVSSVYIQEIYSGTVNQSSTSNGSIIEGLSQSAIHYFTFSRSGNVLTVESFSDSARTVSEGSGSLTLASTSTGFVFLQHGTENPSTTVTGVTIDNIKYYNGVSSLTSKPTNVQDNSILVEKDTAKRFWFSTPATTTEVGATGNSNAPIDYATYKYISGLTAGDTITSVTLDIYNASTNIKVGVYDSTGSGTSTSPNSLRAQGVGAVSVSNTYTTVTIPLTTTTTVPSNGIVWVGIFPQASVDFRATTDSSSLYTNSKHGSGVSGATYANAMPSTAWVAGNGTYNVRFGVVYKVPTWTRGHLNPEWTVDQNFSSSTGWTFTNTSGTYWNIASTKLNWRTDIARSGSGANYDLTTGQSVSNLDSYDAWLLRFELTLDTAFGRNHDALCNFGIHDNDDFGNPPNNGDYDVSHAQVQIQVSINDLQNNLKRFQAIAENSDDIGQDQTMHNDITMQSKYYIEIKKTDATTYVVGYSLNSDYTTSQTVRTVTGVTLSGLKYLHFEAWEQGNNSSYESWGQGWLENLKFYAGVSSV